MSSCHSSLPSAAGSTANRRPNPNHSGGFAGRRLGTGGIIRPRAQVNARISASTSSASSGGSGASWGGVVGTMSSRPSARCFVKTVRGHAAGAQIVPASISHARLSCALSAPLSGGRFAFIVSSIGRVATPMMEGARGAVHRLARPALPRAVA